MPKQILKLEQFHGGLSTNSDPRDVADNELTAATDVMVDELGKIRMMGGNDQHYNYTNTANNPNNAAAINPGYGLFQFSHDRLEAETAGSASAETGDNYLVMADTDGAADVDIYSRVTNNWGTSKIDLGSTTGMKPCFYAVDGALRVSDGNFGANNTNKWYGYIKRTHFSGTAPGGAADDYDGWFSKDQEISAPTLGLYLSYLSGSATNDGESTATNLRATVSSWSTSKSGLEESSIGLDSSNYIAVGTSNNLARVITARIDTDDLTTESLGGGTWQNATYEIYPLAGTGFNVDIAPNTGVTGTWSADDYEIGTTFIYDGIQESLPFENIGPVSGVAIAADNGIDVEVYCVSPFNPRITGGRVYIRPFASGEQWSLLVDINLKEGVRASVDDDYTAWTLETATGSGDAGTDVYLNVSGTNKLTVLNKNPFTYEILNGWPQDEKSIHAVYNTAVVANRIVYIANIQVTNEDGETVIMGDTMIKSPVNKFDTFPLSRKIEASVNDGDEIVKLEEYADRILQFKKNKMHLINISQELEFLEDTFLHKGVSHPAAVCKTDFGIAWVNTFGCYIYDGQKVTNLLEKGGRQIIKESEWATFTTNEPMIGYIPKKRQLVIVDDNTSTGDGSIFLYDLVTQSWIKGAAATFTSADLTNFVTDWNGDLIHAHTDDTGTVEKWDDSSDATDTISFKTKDIDFGQPAQRKKIYKVYVSYKGDGSAVDIQYAVNGDTDTVAPFYRTTADGSTDGANSDTTPLLASNTDDWIPAELKPVSSINNVKSFQLLFDGTAAADFEINDISIVYRMKGIK